VSTAGRWSHSACWTRGCSVVLVACFTLATGIIGVTGAGAASRNVDGIAPGPINVGMIEPLSGALAPLGEDVLDSTRAFIQQLNASGGIDGHKLNLITENDQDNPANAVSEAGALASDHIAVAFGASLGSSLAEVIPVFTKDKIIIINNDATDAYAYNTSLYPYYFTVQPSNRQDMQAMVNYAKEGGLKVGIITDGLPYSENLVSDFQSEAAKAGVKVVSTQSYSPVAVALTTQVTALKDAGATAVATLGETQFPAIYQSMSQLNFNVPILGDAVTGTVPSNPSDTVAPCIDPLKKGQQPTAAEKSAATLVKAAGISSSDQSATPLYRDEVQLYADAVKKAHSTATAAVVAQLQKMTKVAPTTPGYLQTFTAKSHAGWAGVDTACQVSPLGPDGYPYVAPAPTS
jgi:ABC-type branched-subunit amino acid transport system substrate-binding protein